MNFEPKEYLVDSVKSEDVIKIKVALSEYIRMHSGNRREIEAALNYVKKEVPYINLMETHDGITFKSKGEWNKEYVWELISDLMENFSRERLQHILEVGEYLNPQQLKENKSGAVKESKVDSHSSNVKFKSHSTPRVIGKKNQRIVATGVTAGIIIGVAILSYLMGRK